MQILAPISLGELIDKITILELKLEYISNQDKLQNIDRELTELNSILSSLKLKQDLTAQRTNLKQVNRELWHIENYKRDCEQIGNFDLLFIDAARNVYLMNDQRAVIKKTINTLTGSSIVEEKSYSQ